MSSTPIILPEQGQDTAENSAEAEIADTAQDNPPQAADAFSLEEAISSAAPFRGLGEAIITAIAETAEKREYSSGQTVFSLGQYDGVDAFVVAKGRLRVSVINAETGAMMVDDIAQGRSFAIDLTFCGADLDVFSRLSMTAEEDLLLVSIDAEALREVAGQRPSLMRNLAQYFAQELGARRFQSLAAQAAPQQRVCSELLRFVQRDDVSGEWRIEQMPKHRELAEMADVDESIAAETVAMLIQEGIARRDYPGLVILEMARLNELSA